MSDPAAQNALPTDAAAAPAVDDRRHDRDRRHGVAGGGRRGRHRESNGMRLAKRIGFSVFAIAMLVSTILVAVRNTRPIYAKKATLTERLAQRVDSLSRVRGQLPADTGALAEAPQGPLHFRDAKVEEDRRRFAEDLVATGRMKPERADSIAFYAVRESYGKGIPPALMLGVMLTENTVFISKAKSNVGAVGLMQIYPKVWLKALSGKLGSNLENDETNLKYGAFILAEYLRPRKGKSVTSASVRKGLLNYNGCVRGTNTPRCHTYPNKIEKYVRSDAKSICRGKGFEECIARPFMAGLTGDTTSSGTAD